MMSRVAGCVRLIASVSVLAVGCLTFQVTNLANRPHYVTAPILGISGAYRTIDAVFVTLDVQVSDDRSASAYTLEIPLNLPALAVDAADIPIAEAGGMILHHVAS